MGYKEDIERITNSTIRKMESLYTGTQEFQDWYNGEGRWVVINEDQKTAMFKAYKAGKESVTDEMEKLKGELSYINIENVSAQKMIKKIDSLRADIKQKDEALKVAIEIVDTFGIYGQSVNIIMRALKQEGRDV